jgi:hypothetical protein
MHFARAAVRAMNFVEAGVFKHKPLLKLRLEKTFNRLLRFKPGKAVADCNIAGGRDLGKLCINRPDSCMR